MQIKKQFVSRKLSQLTNIESERNIIGILLMDENGEATEEIFAQLNIVDFCSEQNQKIFQVMKAIFEKGQKIDLVSALDVFERQFGTDEYNDIFNVLNNCMSQVIGTSIFAQQIKIVKDYSNLRKIENACYLGFDLVKSGKSAESVSGVLQDELTKVSESEIANDCEQITKEAELTFNKIKKRVNGEYDEFGIETGFKCLDKCLWGLQKSDLVVVAARAGVGKTAFALNVINFAAVENKKKVAFFSLEMPKSQITERLFSLGTGISNYDLKAGKLNTKYKEVEDFKTKLQASKLYIDDDSNNTVPKMLLKAKRLQRREGLDLVVIDYLQFIKPQEKSGNRFQDVGEIARGLKSMARELNVPVIALCQLNRQLDNDGREPTLADLRESGEIENNADIVMFLNSKSSRADEVKNIDLIIGKFRNGMLRKIRMTYKGENFKFSEEEKMPEKSKGEQTAISELTPIEDAGLPF